MNVLKIINHSILSIVLCTSFSLNTVHSTLNTQKSPETYKHALQGLDVSVWWYAQHMCIWFGAIELYSFAIWLTR